MVPPESLENNSASMRQLANTSAPILEHVAFDAGMQNKLFSEKIQVIVLLVFAAVLTCVFIKFVEQDITQTLHFSNRAVQIAPAGYEQ